MDNIYFFIEPFVHIFQKKNNVLFYNSLSGDILSFYNNVLISKIATRLLLDKNLYVIKLNKKEIEDTEIEKFIFKIRKKFMGDILYNSQYKPIQIVPFVKLKSELSRFKSDPLKWDNISLKNMLFELTVFVNTNNCSNVIYARNIYKQFQFPYYPTKSVHELKVNEITRIISSLIGSKLQKINILGNNILIYNQLYNFIKYLNCHDFIKEYYFLYDDIFNKDFLVFIKQMDKKSIINISLIFPIVKNNFSGLYNILKKTLLNINFQLIISNHKQLQLAENFIEEYKLVNYFFKPLYTSNNLNFFKKTVFLTKKEIMNFKPTLEDIFTRQSINEYDFGKLTIIPNGNIYANLNNPALGNMSIHSLNDVILKEITIGKSWKTIRSNVLPCKHCIFQNICPTISNYERVIKQNNLCKVNI